MRALPLLLFTFACKPDAEDILDDLPPAALNTAEAVQYWSSVSAPNLLLNAYSPLLAVYAAEEQGPVDCPVGSAEGDVTTYTGGCTDNEGNTWEGTLTVHPDAIVYTGLELGQPSEDCPGAVTTLFLDGRLGGDREAEPLSFSLDLAMHIEGPDASCDPSGGELAILYNGTQRADGEAELWSGTGRVGDTERGWVDATTTDERLDQSVCPTQAASGQTTLTNGTDVVVITYDGATDCDEQSEVPWSLNGEPQGMLSGVSCAVGGPAGGALAAVLALGMLRRRQKG